MLGSHVEKLSAFPMTVRGHQSIVADRSAAREWEIDAAQEALAAAKRRLEKAVFALWEAQAEVDSASTALGRLAKS